MPTIQKTLRIFDFIKRVVGSTGMPPTIAEMQRQFQFSSPASVHRHIKIMRQRGWITIIPNVSRGIRLVEQEQKDAA